MVRYPHTLVVTWETEGSWDNGDYTPGETVTHTIKGRAEANGSGSMVQLEDGAQVVYNWTFYSQPINFTVPFQADATLTHNTGMWSGKVLRAAVNQKGMQIWL